jgi:hypothetical protein
MVSDKLKQLIFNRLYKELGNAEIIPHKNSIWFINREEKYWYFELENNGNLYWRYNYFTNFFSWFSLEPNQFEPIISEWVDEVLNHKVSTTIYLKSLFCKRVEEVLNHKVSTTKVSLYQSWYLVEEVLNHRVNTTGLSAYDYNEMVEEVLNNTEQNESNR